MEGSEQTAFDLGWDYATFGINVPEDASKSFCDGYRAFSSGCDRTSKEPDKFVRKWLQIRFGALRRGKSFSQDVSPEYIEKITPASGNCPVTELVFTYGTGESSDWSVDRANNDRGYIRGNIIIISQLANSAKGDKSLCEIQRLSSEDSELEGLLPEEWNRLARIIEPAFGEHDDEVSPIPILLGQPIALGMPISPIAGFQIAMSRALIEGWDPRRREVIAKFVDSVQNFVCETKDQRRSFVRLKKEIIRRGGHVNSYAEVWATPRIQKRLWSFVSTLDSDGLMRLAKLQDITVGSENKKIA